LVRQQHPENNDSIDQQQIGPEVHVFNSWVVQLVNKHKFKGKNKEHYPKLWSSLKVTFLEDIAEDNDFVKDYE